ncbi:MAG: DNA polymerase III subunit [Planctomycetes bacterium]|nr:DNA polymerase III subunit [Planctomycetota bacterium]
MADERAPWPLYGHGDLLRGLWRAARSERLPHGLLFHGPVGLGKFRAARALAQGLFCGAPGDDLGPCGACGPCKRFLSGGHPDLFVIDPPREIDEQIRVGHIVPRDGPGEPGESAASFLALRPSEGGWRIVILRQAERMGEQAQNALLKMLEEPGESVLWVLTTEKVGALLPTIQSRVVSLRFRPLPQEECLAVLAAEGLSPEDARRLARWSGFSPGVALSLGERGVPAMRKLALALLCGELSPFEAAAAVGEVDGVFEGKTPSGRERERARTWIDLCGALLGDLARLAAGADAARLAHGDMAQASGKIALLREPRVLASAVHGLTTARADVDLNLDPGAAIERAAQMLAAREWAQLPG